MGSDQLLPLGQTGQPRSAILPPSLPSAFSRSIQLLPKAHLHLHFTGSMTVDLLRRMAAEHSISLNRELLDAEPLRVPADRRGWFRFQRLYDMARRCVQTEQDMRDIVDEAARIDAAEGSKILELQVTPDSYAKIMGGLSPALEVILDEAKQASARHHIAVGIIVAAARTHHPLEAKTLARLAAQYAGDRPGTVVGFGLSNDERSGRTADFLPAFRIAAKAGLPLMPHAGELLGSEHVAEVVQGIQPLRIGHGVRSVDSPAVLRQLVERQITLEVCPASNVGLGVFADKTQVPLRQLFEAGVPIALGADDPLLFGERLEQQYEDARKLHGFSDEDLARLARQSIAASALAASYRDAALRQVDEWLISR